MNDKPITADRAAKILGVSAMRVRQLCQRGLIGQKVGVQWILTETEVRTFKPLHKRKRGPEKKI